MCEEYNGWTNRETWATALHIDNEQGFTNTASEKIQESFLEDMDKDKADGWQDGLTSATLEIQEWVEEMLSFSYWDEHGLEMPDNIKRMKADVGSLWRVNFREIVQSWLIEEIESFKQGKYNEGANA